MRRGSDIISAIHCIRQAYEHFESFQRDHPESRGARLMKHYNGRLEYIYRDLISLPALTEEVREGVRKEWASDVFAVPAIAEQVALLNPQQREFIETLVDAMLKGEEVKMIEQ